MRRYTSRSITRLMARSEKLGPQDATVPTVMPLSAGHKKFIWRRSRNRQVFRRHPPSWPRESRLALREEWWCWRSVCPDRAKLPGSSGAALHLFPATCCAPCFLMTSRNNAIRAWSFRLCARCCARDSSLACPGTMWMPPISHRRCLERNRRRERTVAEDVMRRMAAKLRPPTFEEGFSKIVVVRVKSREGSGEGEGEF